MNKLYLRRGERGRGFIGLEIWVQIEVNSLGKYLQISNFNVNVEMIFSNAAKSTVEAKKTSK